jgi:hypothetical protein
VVRHEQVIRNKPCGGVAPGCFEVLLGDGIGKPGGAIFGADSEEDAGGLRRMDVDTGRGIMAAGAVDVGKRVHGRIIPDAEESGREK